MNMKHVLALAVTVSVGASAAAFAQTNVQVNELRMDSYKGDMNNARVEVEAGTVTSGTSAVKEVQVGMPLVLASGTDIPANTVVTGTLATGLFTANSHPGDTVKVILDHPLVTSKGEVILPAGSKLIGKVMDVNNAHGNDNDAMLEISFDEVQTPDGLSIPIKATIGSADGKLWASQPSGVVRVPTASFYGLKADMNSKVGATYGTENGKISYYSNGFGEAIYPGNSNLLSSETVENEILLGVGDKMQVRFTNPVNVTWMAPR